jgi:hypothetical protein
MDTKLAPGFSRRDFLVSTSMATSAALLAPHHLLVQDEVSHRQPEKQQQPLQ